MKSADLRRLTPEELEVLHRAAGLDKGWYKLVDVVLLDEEGKEVPAVTYIIPNPTGPFCPSASYVRPILVGARALQLPEPYIKELREIIESTQ